MTISELGPNAPSLAQKLREEGTLVDMDTADEWLRGYNEGNRTYKPKKLALYIRDMYNDAWYDNGDPMYYDIDASGRKRFFEGQHRLKALIEASRRRINEGREPIALRFFVYQADHRTRLITGSGAPRTFNDRRVIAGGTSYARQVVPVGKRIYNWQNGVLVPTTSTRLDLSEVEFADFYQQNMGAVNGGAHWGGSLNVKIGIHAAAAGLGHYIATTTARAHFERTEVDVAHLFFHSLASGANIGTGHPALTLRNTLARRRRDHTLRNAEESLALLLGAWNAFAEERPFKSATLPSGMVVTSANLPIPVAPNVNWTGDVYRDSSGR